MSLQYIIDAYNIINHPQFRPRARKSLNIQSLLADFIILNRLTGSRKNKLILVFDGYPPQGEKMPDAEGLVCLFSRLIEADEVIKKLVEESGQPANIIVVSDDKGIQTVVRFLGAKISSVEEFICGKKSARVFGSALEEREENKVSYSDMQVINAELKKKWLK
ncbi:MAG: NYN domain-containing protein [Candidatus Omnitrophota bacterium]